MGYVGITSLVIILVLLLVYRFAHNHRHGIIPLIMCILFGCGTCLTAFGIVDHREVGGSLVVSRTDSFHLETEESILDVNKSEDSQSSNHTNMIMVNTKSYKSLYKDYLEKGVKLSQKEKLGVAFLVIVIAGFVGWLYEVFLARIELGSFYMRGRNFLPWISIYAVGALLVIPFTYKFRENLLLVFLISALVTGTLELVTGWAMAALVGSCPWNYNHGLWLIGSINGYVCLLSVMIFGVFSLVLVYLVVPLTIFLSAKISFCAFLTVSSILFSLVMIDEIANLCLNVLNRPNAVDFYKRRGIKY